MRCGVFAICRTGTLWCLAETKARTTISTGSRWDRSWACMGSGIAAIPGCCTRLSCLTKKEPTATESAEPISFDVAGDFVFVAYTRGLKAEGIKNAFVKVLRLSDLSTVGNLSAEKDLGETGLLDLVESVRAVNRQTVRYLSFWRMITSRSLSCFAGSRRAITGQFRLSEELCQGVFYGLPLFCLGSLWAFRRAARSPKQPGIVLILCRKPRNRGLPGSRRTHFTRLKKDRL